MESALNVKIGIKPVFSAAVHSDAWEGPCRTGNMEDLTFEAEKAGAKKEFKEFQEELRRNIPSEAKFLEPVYMEYGEDFVVSEKYFKKLEPDLQDTDLFLLTDRTPGPGIARYRKPIAYVDRGDSNVDLSAYLRSIGLEGYAPINYDELNELIFLMKVRKAIQKTRILEMTGGQKITWGAFSSILNLDDLKAKFGTDCQKISIERFFDEMDKVDQKEITELSEKLIKGAQKLNIKKNYVANDVRFYFAIKNLMERYDCNAYTVPCFELCRTRLPEKFKVVPCLPLTLLKDEGYPSSCEGDIGVLLAMMVLMYISKKSSFMGNLFMKVENEEFPHIRRPIPEKMGTLYMKEKNIVQLWHSVPGIKMNGFEKPNLPYELWHFTASGWGTKVQIDMAKNEEKEVTLARFNPLATKILVVKGKVVGCYFREVFCSPAVDIQVSDAKEIMHKRADFGQHTAMVYGDYTSQIEKLSTLMGFEVVKV